MNPPDPISPKPDSDGEAAQAAKLLAAALNPSPVSAPAHAWEPPAVAEVASWFPDYQVEALIGRGAMGAVYRAVQRKLERAVAIKLLPPEIAAREGAAARFEREARAMARLNHPNIVALHDFGRTAQGHLFIVMEHVEGADLSRIIQAEKAGLSVPQALEIVTQVCDALQYAHSRGFVHRDIKPGNVLVDTEGRVKIADFGLAKLLDSPDGTPATSADRLTMTGTVLGTPDYTAPEQLKGGAVDHRADIYSLGVMFYEMLTGDLPRGAWELPSRRSPAASTRLDEVVTRAMQSEPDKRYQQASDVKQAVEGARTSAPASAAAAAPEIKPALRPVAGLLFCLVGLALGGLLLTLLFTERWPWRVDRLLTEGEPRGGPVVVVMLGWLFGMAAVASRTGRFARGFSSMLAGFSGLVVLWGLGLCFASLFAHWRADRDLAVVVYGDLITDERIYEHLYLNGGVLLCFAGLFTAVAVLWFYAQRRRPWLWWGGLAVGPFVLLLAMFTLRMAELRDHPPGTRTPVAAVPLSPRAEEDANALIRDLSDAQEADAHDYAGKGFTRYWTQAEQDTRGNYLDQLNSRWLALAGSAANPDSPLIREAGARLAALAEAHRSRLLPVIPPEKCLNPNWRFGSARPAVFNGSELIPGVSVVSWEGQNEGNAWTYTVRPVKTPPRVLDNEDDGGFWPLDVPPSRPVMPVSTPCSQAEADWIMKLFPNETAADSPGLVIADVETKGDPQLAWEYWSRHTADRIPWEAGQPALSRGQERGRVILKGGKCALVFDTVARPVLCGGSHQEAAAWAVHLFMWSRMAQVGRYLAGEIPKTDLAWPEPMRSLGILLSDFCAKECVAYSPAIAKANAPWMPWQRDVGNLDLVQEMRAKKNTGEGIPFQKLPRGRALVTSILCSRERAEKIATHYGARLPLILGREDMEALARLLPNGSTAHCSINPEAPPKGLLSGWPDRGIYQTPERRNLLVPPERGDSLAVESCAGEGSLIIVPSSALLVLEWPLEEKLPPAPAGSAEKAR